MTEGTPIAFIDATLTLEAVAPSVWDALLPDQLVVARRAELDAGRLLEQARQAAECGDWGAIERLLAVARQRFADQPWLIEVLANMAEIAKSMDAARFKKEALYASRKMGSRISAKEEMMMDLADEALAPSFLRRKTAQGKAQFDKPDDLPK